VNATGDVIASVDGAVVLVVAVGCDWYVLASKDFVTDGVEALVRKERAQTVNVGPGAGTVDSAGLRGAYVIVIAGGEVSKLTFNKPVQDLSLVVRQSPSTDWQTLSKHAGLAAGAQVTVSEVFTIQVPAVGELTLSSHW